MAESSEARARNSPTFGARLGEVFAQHGHLCVGIDPHPYLLDAWGLPDSASGVRDFGLAVVEATQGNAGIVKPQVAFFERFGSGGYAALEDVIRAARSAGLVVVADAKRGDIGTSMDAYAQTWLGEGSPLEADAVTVSPYLGVGSLTGAFELANRLGKGVFVLAATSNSEAKSIQTARLADTRVSVARNVIHDVMAWNRQALISREPSHTGSRSDESNGTGFHGAGLANTMGSVGVVFGATVTASDYGIDVGEPPTPGLPLLVPGFGHQGAAIEDRERILGAFAPFAMISESRSLLAAGPNGVRCAIRESAAVLKDARA